MIQAVDFAAEVRASAEVPPPAWANPFGLNGVDCAASSRRFRGSNRHVFRKFSSFLPPQVPNLALWFRPDLGVTTVSSKASAWQCQAGSAYSFAATQSTAGARPTPSSGDAAYNGQPTMQFAASTFMTGTLGATLSQPCTYFVVGHSTGATFNTMFDAGNTAAGAHLLRKYTAPALWDMATNLVDIGGSAHDVNKHAWCLNFAGASAKMYKDSINTVDGSGNTGSTTLATMTIGGDRFTGTTYPWLGTIAEFIAYTGTLSDANRALVMNYLAARYGVTLS